MDVLPRFETPRQVLHGALHHGAFVLLVVMSFMLAATRAYGQAAEPEEEVVEKAPATPQHLLDGFRRGLFTEVAEEGKLLLAKDPDAQVRGAVAVCLATAGDMDGAATMLGEAVAANEPSHELHGLLVDALAARSRKDSKAEAEACQKAIALDAGNPVAIQFLAESAYQRKDFDLTLELAEQALAIEPKMAPAFLLRGLVFRERKENPEAMKAFNNAVVLNPRDLRPRLAIAETAASLSDHRLAARAYRDILTLNPSVGVVVRERFLQSLIEADQMEEAGKVAADLLAEQPASVIAHLAAGRAAAWLDHWPRAQKHYASFDELAPENDGVASYLSGLCDLAEGRITEAIAAFERSAASAARKSGSLAALGVALHREGKLEEAVKAFGKALNGAHVGLAQRIHFHLGLVSLDQKNWAVAKQHFVDSGSFVANLEIGLIDLEALYGPSPDNALASTSLGVLLAAEKMPSAAGRAFRQSREAYDRNVLALLFESNLLAVQLRYDEAARLLADVRRNLEDYWPAHYASGSVEFSRRRYDLAIPYFVKALEGAPDNKNVHQGLIALYLLTNRSEEAEAACLKMIERLPDSPMAYNELAGLLTVRGDPESLASGEELATIAVGLEPKNGLYLDTLGWVYFKQGKNDLALAQLRKAVDLAPGNPEVQYHLGAALFKAGKLSEAADHLKLAMIGAAGSSIAKEASELLKQIPAEDEGNADDAATDD